MDRVKITVLSVFLGLLYAYFAVYIAGIGAAIAIPAEILTPFVKDYPIFTFAMIDLITIGLPLIIIYCVFALLINHLNVSKSYFPYIALLLPYFALSIYFFSLMEPPQNWVYTFGTIVPRYFVLIVFAIFFITRATRYK
ncbi:hypothetical protein [Thalassotalea piscium]|uniref:Putative paraquat-inducible protein A n=1 Tax=Thalassotalea piscium TaxID=1230533 RepID=A0A7X0NHU0_9GAMM|nr:hypothetical protein [Thalassotalea piscium]MBB6543664.1 putative paraquat-inducible protein A [Thalassotalea piscium]